MQIKRFFLSSERECTVKDTLSALSHAKNVVGAFWRNPNNFEAKEIRQLKPPHHLVIRKLPNTRRAETYKQAISRITQVVETIRVLGLPIDISEDTSVSSTERDPKKQKIIHVID